MPRHAPLLRLPRHSRDARQGGGGSPSSIADHGESRVERGLLHKGRAASPSLGLPPSSSFTFIVLGWLGLSVEHHSFCLTVLLLLSICIFHLHSLFPARNCVCRPSESISLLQQLSCLSILPGCNFHLFFSSSETPHKTIDLVSLFHLDTPPVTTGIDEQHQPR